MRTALALVIVFVVISPAAADIVLQSSPGTPLPAGNLVQYTISAVGTAGETIGGFANPSITAVGAGLGVHNVRLALPNASSPTKTWHLLPLWKRDWSNYDTYFLFDDTIQIRSVGPQFSETNDGATTGTLGLSTSYLGFETLESVSGFGTYNSDPTSAKAVLEPWQGSNVPFMQVVLRAQDSARLQVLVAPPGTGVPPSVEREIVIGPFVPEPSTCLLATIGGVACLLRRR